MEEIENLSEEINSLQKKVNSSQYGGDPESELAEVQRIQNESLPKLQSMLLELQQQLADNNKNPFFKVFKQEGAELLVEGSKRQQAYYREYFL